MTNPTQPTGSSLAALEGLTDAELRNKLAAEIIDCAQNDEEPSDEIGAKLLYFERAIAARYLNSIEKAVVNEAYEILQSCGLFAYISAHADKLRWENRNSPPNNQWGESTFAAIAEDHNKVKRALDLLASAHAVTTGTPSAEHNGKDAL